MSGNIQEISSTIRDIVALGGRVSGSRLSTDLKERIPSWSPAEFGVKNLREFISIHVPDVLVLGRSGMDIVYGVEGGQPPQPAEVPPKEAEGDFWRIWVSPNSPFALVIDRNSAAVRTISRGAAIGADEVLMQPPKVDVHRDVARKFVTNLPDEMRPKLQAILETPNEQWWHAWLRELRATAQLPSWNNFRRRSFENYLCSQLRAAELDEVSVAQVLKTVSERLASTSARSARVRTTSMLARLARVDGEELRRVVLEAIPRMSEEELRDLRLPVGIVLDVMASSKGR